MDDTDLRHISLWKLAPMRFEIKDGKNGRRVLSRSDFPRGGVGVARVEAVDCGVFRVVFICILG